MDRALGLMTQQVAPPAQYRVLGDTRSMPSTRRTIVGYRALGAVCETGLSYEAGRSYAVGAACKTGLLYSCAVAAL